MFVEKNNRFICEECDHVFISFLRDTPDECNHDGTAVLKSGLLLESEGKSNE